MRILVTGGSGFIGSQVVDQLLARSDEIWNYDIKPPTFRRHEPCWHKGDVLDPAGLAAAFAAFRPQRVMHLAAHAEITATEWEAFASIHRGTANLLKAIEGYGELERLLNVSTQLVIGPEYRPRSMLDYEPYTLYGEAKAYAESLVLQWQAPTHWVTVRPAMIWGPHHPSFAENIWKYICSGAYLHPATSAPVLRTYGYVRNTAQQMIAVLDADPAVTYRQVYYLSDEVMDSAIWTDAFSLALRGKPSRRIPVKALKAMGLAGDLALKLGKRLPMDSGRATRMTESHPVPLEPTHALTGAPPVAFETGVAESVAWLRAGAPVRVD